MNETSKRNWREMLAAVTAFVRDNERNPSQVSDDREERKLAVWRNYNVSQFGRGLLPAARARAIEASGLHLPNTEREWRRRLAALKAHLEKHNCQPDRWDPDPEVSSLGRWRHQQMAAIKHNALAPDRKRLFVETGAAEDKLDGRWHDHLAELTAFVHEHGRLPHREGETASERSLNLWLSMNQRALRGGRLSAERSRALKESGVLDMPPPSRPSEKWNAKWERQFTAFENFVNSNGGYPRRDRTGLEGRLYDWFSRQRQKRDQGTLAAEHTERLAPHFHAYRPISRSHHVVWPERCAEIERFAERLGRLPLETDGNAYENRLARWIREQRKAAAAGNLSTERVAWLDRIEQLPQRLATRRSRTPGEVKIFERFEQRCREYREWMSRHGAEPAPRTDDPDERRLYAWRITQRAKYRRGMLDPEQTALLEQLGFGESRLDREWTSLLLRVKHFRERHGRPPTRHGGDPVENMLASWRYHNIKLMRRGLLDPVRTRRLMAAGIHGDNRDTLWQARFQEFQRFIQRTGRFPSRESRDTRERSLAKWRDTQMTRHRAGVLSPERTKEFTELGYHRSKVDLAWRRKLKMAVQFIKEHQRLPHPASSDTLESELGRWIDYNRRRHARGLLPSARQSLLRSASIPLCPEMGSDRP